MKAGINSLDHFGCGLDIDFGHVGVRFGRVRNGVCDLVAATYRIPRAGESLGQYGWG